MSQTDSTIPRQGSDLWRAHFQKHPLKGIPLEEVEAHIEHLPDSYWENITESELVWSLEMVHRFLVKAIGNQSHAPSVVVDWRHDAQRNISRVMVCEWDRAGLLAQITAAFSALQINVQRADVYTRSDNIALDIFEVTDSATGNVVSAGKLQQLGLFIESGLKEPLGYVISRLSEPVDAPARKSTIRPRLHFKNSDFTSRTIMEVMASDRLGLLYDILQALTTLRLQITQAIIDTDGEVANDQILFTDEHGQQVLDNFQLGQIRNAVIQAIE